VGFKQNFLFLCLGAFVVNEMHLKSTDNKLNLKIKGGKVKRFIIIFLIFFVLFRGDLFGFQPPVYLNIEDFGAVANDEILDTKAINKAIDSCSTFENGVIIFSSGTYLSGSIHLKSNVTLQIEKEAKIQAAPKGTSAFDSPEPNSWDRYQDFGHSHFHNALIWGDGIEDVTIKGGGTISGTASLKSDARPGEADKVISLKSCRFVKIEDMTIDDGGYLSVLAADCEGVNIHNVRIKTEENGISIVGCNDVYIINCDIETAVDKKGISAGVGDAISLKSNYSLGRELKSKGIEIKSCVISTDGNALRLGPETIGDFQNIKILNITIERADEGGIIFTSNDGAVIDGILVENVTMENVMIPIFINLADRKSKIPGVSKSSGMIKNVRVNNLVAKDVYSFKKGMGLTGTIMGKSGRPIDNMVLENIRITYKGGSLSYLGLTSDPAAIKLPVINDYRPEEYGLRPAYGFYFRYIKGLRIRNVLVDVEKEDPRPAMILKDVEGAALDRFYAHRTTLRDYDIILDNVKDFSMTGSLGIVQIEKKDFTPLTRFDVEALPHPTAEEVAKKLGIGKTPVLLSDLPAKVIEKIKNEFAIPANLLNSRVSSDIKKDGLGNRAVYTLEVSDSAGDKYILRIREDGSLLSKTKI
jgi:hypothetical protein